MNDAKVLVIDADEERADSVMTLLKFIDCNAQLHASITGVTQGVKPADWSAIILGKVRAAKGLVAFMDWLRRDHRHPPLLPALVLPNRQCLGGQIQSLPTERQGLADSEPAVGLQRQQRGNRRPEDGVGGPAAGRAPADARQ